MEILKKLRDKGAAGGWAAVEGPVRAAFLFQSAPMLPLNVTLDFAPSSPTYLCMQRRRRRSSAAPCSPRAAPSRTPAWPPRWAAVAPAAAQHAVWARAARPAPAGAPARRKSSCSARCVFPAVLRCFFCLGGVVTMQRADGICTLCEAGAIVRRQRHCVAHKSGSHGAYSEQCVALASSPPPPLQWTAMLDLAEAPLRKAG